MGWLVDKEKTYEYTIENDVGEKADISIRKLDEGDFQDRQDLVARINFGPARSGRRGRKKGRKQVDTQSQSMVYAIGEIRRFDILRSLVDWDVDLPLTETTIRKLDPGVAEAIHEKIADLNPFIFGDDENDDDDDDPVDGDDDDVGDEDPTMRS